MRSLSTILRIAMAGGLLAVLALAVPANAGPVYPASRTWNLTQYNGTSTTNSLTFNSTVSSSDPYKITAKAYKVAKQNKTGSYWMSSKLKADTLGAWSGGLGVENLSSPEHAVDNNNGWDFIVFKLPTNNWNTFSFLLDPYGSRRDMHTTILYGTPNASLGITGVNSFADKTVNQLLSNGFLSMNFDGLFLDNTNQAQTISFNTNVQVNYIIVAASLQPLRVSDDNFKIKAITGKLVTYVPESPTIAAFGAGLLGLGIFATRRRKALKRA